MTTFSFYSFRILKISPYINLKKFFVRILAPPSGRRPGADAPPRYATASTTDYDVKIAKTLIIDLLIMQRRIQFVEERGRKKLHAAKPPTQPFAGYNHHHFCSGLATGFYCRYYPPVKTGPDNTPKSGFYWLLLLFFSFPPLKLS